MIAGESRPAASCARIQHLVSHKGRRIPSAGTLEIHLPDLPASGAPRLLDVEAYTYGVPPRDKLLRRAMRTLSPLLSMAREDHALRRLLKRDPAFRPAAQPRGVLVTQLPRTLTLRFDPVERGRRAAFSVWAWTLPDPQVVLDAVRPRSGERLAIGFGVRDRGWEGGPPVTFQMTATPAQGGPDTVMWRGTLDPARVESDRGWQEAEIDLPPLGGPLRLTLAARGPVEAAGLAAWARPALIGPAPEAATAPPSILLLSIDTLRGDHVGAYGWRRATTPVIDRVAASGVLFEQAVAHFPSTTASHMTMFTSVAPCAHGVLGPNSTPLGDTIPTLTELLAARGYATVGITEDGLIIGDLGFNRGFDSYRDLEPTDEPLGVFTQGIALARAWLERHGARPFFMFLHTYQVHPPFKVPPHLRDLFPVDAGADEAHRLEADYDAGLRHADELFGGLLEYLESSGLLARTVLVVTSDHGTEFGEHGGIGHGRGVYEEQLRVPLVFHHPALAAGRRVRAQVGLVDLAPTLLDLAGAPPSVTFGGRTLAAMLRGADLGDGAAPAIFADQLWNARETLLRDGRFAWIQKQRGLELYDLETDPGEHHDLAAAAPERAAEGARRIGEFRDACPRLSMALHAGRGYPQALDPERLRALRALGYVQ